MVADRQAGLAAADHDHVEALAGAALRSARGTPRPLRSDPRPGPSSLRCSFIGSLLVAARLPMERRLAGALRPDFGRTTHFHQTPRAWVVLPNEPVLIGPGGRRGARGHVELGEDVAHVPVDGLLAQEELAGRSPCWSCPRRRAAAPRARARSGRARPARGRTRRRSRGAPSPRSPPRRGRRRAGRRPSSRRLELERRAVLVAERAETRAPRASRMRALRYGAPTRCHTS